MSSEAEASLKASSSSASLPQANAPVGVAVVAADVPPIQVQPASNDNRSDGILTQSLATVDLIFGIYGIELWHYDEASGKLAIVNLDESQDEETGNSGVRNGGGLLLKRKPQETDPDNNYSTPEALDAFNNLTNASQSGYISVGSTDPGVGLAGALWAELGSGHDVGANLTRAWGVGHHVHDTIQWRDVCELADDPDQPFDARLQALAKAGFKLATGIPFDVNGYRGIVIAYGNPHGDRNKLNNPANVRFMNNAAQLIGAAAAIQTPMAQVKAFRKEEAFNNWHRMKIKLLTIVRMLGVLRYSNDKSGGGMTSDSTAKSERRSSIQKLREASVRMRENAKETAGEMKEAAKNKATRWGKKVRGGSAGIAPAFTWGQFLWTFIGVMTTHTILSRINLTIMTLSEKEFNLVLAPLGALTTLQYCLTAAPASQPRNAIFAQIFSITTAICLSYIPNIPPWFRSALAPAIVIPGMAKLGIIHPPAGASAIVFSTWKDNSWEQMGIFLAGVAIAIITAVGINNMSDRRQYPTSWYLINKAKKAIVGENELGQVTVIKKAP